MKFYKYFYWVYLVMAVLFLYDGVDKMTSGYDFPWLSFVCAAVAIFMFFFRRKFSKNLERRYKK